MPKEAPIWRIAAFVPEAMPAFAAETELIIAAEAGGWINETPAPDEDQADQNDPVGGVRGGGEQDEHPGPEDEHPDHHREPISAPLRDFRCQWRDDHQRDRERNQRDASLER